VGVLLHVQLEIASVMPTPCENRNGGDCRGKKLRDVPIVFKKMHDVQ
jgi:hypothetical protein